MEGRQSMVIVKRKRCISFFRDVHTLKLKQNMCVEREKGIHTYI